MEGTLEYSLERCSSCFWLLHMSSVLSFHYEPEAVRDFSVVYRGKWVSDLSHTNAEDCRRIRHFGAPFFPLFGQMYTFWIYEWEETEREMEQSVFFFVFFSHKPSALPFLFLIRTTEDIMYKLLVRQQQLQVLAQKHSGSKQCCTLWLLQRAC